MIPSSSVYALVGEFNSAALFVFLTMLSEEPAGDCAISVKAITSSALLAGLKQPQQHRPRTACKLLSQNGEFLLVTIGGVGGGVGGGVSGMLALTGGAVTICGRGLGSIPA